MTESPSSATKDSSVLADSFSVVADRFIVGQMGELHFSLSQTSKPLIYTVGSVLWPPPLSVWQGWDPCPSDLFWFAGVPCGFAVPVFPTFPPPLGLSMGSA